MPAYADNPISPEQPRHRIIMAVDVEGSTARTDTVKAWLRHALYQLYEHALQAAGITDDFRDPLIDRGDGILALIHPVDQVPQNAPAEYGHIRSPQGIDQTL